MSGLTETRSTMLEFHLYFAINSRLLSILLAMAKDQVTSVKYWLEQNLKMIFLDSDSNDWVKSKESKSFHKL